MASAIGTPFLAPASAILRQRTPLGLLLDEFTENTVTLSPGSRLLLYTDGISEALNCKDEEFGGERLADFVSRHDCSVSRPMQAIREFHGTCPPGGDATVVLMQCTE